MHRATEDVLVGTRVVPAGEELVDVDPRRLARLVKSGAAVAVPGPDGPVPAPAGPPAEVETADLPPAERLDVETGEVPRNRRRRGKPFTT